jgi:soluble lytic murein transglycosylase
MPCPASGRRPAAVLIRALPALGLTCLSWLAGAAVPDRAHQRELFRSALDAASHGHGDDWKKLAIDLADYPLLPYVELAALHRDAGKAKLDRATVERFIARWPDTLPARDLRQDYLRERANASDWPAFRALWQETGARDLACDDLNARLAAGETLAFADIEPLWNDARLASDCVPAFTWARAHGVLDEAQVWARVGEAAGNGHAGTVSTLAGLLHGSDRADAARLASVLGDPATALAKASRWPDDARAREAAALGLARLARRNTDDAETLWTRLEKHFGFSRAQKERVLHALALYRAASYAPNALARLKALPDAANDADTRAWRVRVAIAARDWNEALAALDALDDEQKTDSRWRYLRARVLVKLERKDEADAILAAVATEADYYGFLAADWIGAPYALCPDTLAGDPAIEARLEQQPDLARAFEFQALDEWPQARREWAFAMDKLDPDERRMAADLAYRRGWYDRAVFAYGADPAAHQLYAQRFPLALKSDVTRSAHAAGIDPAWAYAIIRAESAWVADAHSGADAWGLMQLLPGVGRQLARELKLSWDGPRELLDPVLNIRLGTRYLAQMAADYDGSPWLASAAYNAGKTPLARWITERGMLDPDFFIETMPYHETRDYVARVLAFSVIYDWRLDGRVVPLAARMPRIGQPYHAPTAKTPRKAVMCPATPATAAPATAAGAP